MRVTLLDNLVETVQQFQRAMPLYRSMGRVIEQCKPMCHHWPEDNPLQVHLPNEPLGLPQQNICLFSPRGITTGYYSLCIDHGAEFDDPAMNHWINDQAYMLDGVMVFQATPDYFEAVPLCRCGGTVLPEVQLAFRKGENGWHWDMSRLGPINAMFHSVVAIHMDDEGKQELEDNVSYLGNLVSLYLGSYVAYLNTPGRWDDHPAKAAKVKVKKNTCKVVRPGTLGYIEYQQENSDGH